MRRRTGTAAKLAPVVACALVLCSCATMRQTVQDNPKAVLGTVLGAAAGAGIAAAAGGGAGAIVGAGLGGALIGGFVGNRLDDRRQRHPGLDCARTVELHPPVNLEAPPPEVEDQLLDRQRVLFDVQRRMRLQPLDGDLTRRELGRHDGAAPTFRGEPRTPGSQRAVEFTIRSKTTCAAPEKGRGLVVGAHASGASASHGTGPYAAPWLGCRRWASRSRR